MNIRTIIDAATTQDGSGIVHFQGCNRCIVEITSSPAGETVDIAVDIQVTPDSSYGSIVGGSYNVQQQALPTVINLSTFGCCESAKVRYGNKSGGSITARVIKDYAG